MAAKKVKPAAVRAELRPRLTLRSDGKRWAGVEYDGLVQRFHHSLGEPLLRAVLRVADEMLSQIELSAAPGVTAARALARLAIGHLADPHLVESATVERALDAAKRRDVTSRDRRRRAELVALVERSNGSELLGVAAILEVFGDTREQATEGSVRLRWLYPRLVAFDSRFSDKRPTVERILLKRARANSSSVSLAAELAWRAGLEKGTGKGPTPVRVIKNYEASVRKPPTRLRR